MVAAGVLTFPRLSGKSNILRPASVIEILEHLSLAMSYSRVYA